jgi:regulator of sigma E protease
MNILHYVQSAGAVILTFGMVIFLHESGHFFLCRWLGVRVEKFAFGFGPELLGITGSSGTRFSICALPLGGFVKPAGEEPETCSGAPDEYFGQNWYRRLAIVAAGPAMNYLLAFTLFTGVVYIKGMPEAVPSPIIGNMMNGFPADEAGLQLDDEVIAVNGDTMKTWDDLAGTIHKFPGKEITLTYRRREVTATIKVTPRKDDASGNGVIGIMPKSIYTPVDFVTAMREGVHQCYALTKMTITTISSKIYKRERPDLAGPVGIVQMVSRAAHSGWEDLVFLIGLISVAIGFFNILPVPLLDGGHAAMYIWEGIAGRRPSKEASAAANSVGIAFLFSLLLFATYNDVMRIHSEHAARPKSEAAAPAKPN